jgi:hypothetical protein
VAIASTGSNSASKSRSNVGVLGCNSGDTDS